jgi:hypothetical protein
VPKTLEFLRQTYPNRRWTFGPLSDRSRPPADLVICADVIEHVLNPEQLMTFLVSVSRNWLVLSTPDRRREYSLVSRFQLGPLKFTNEVLIEGRISIAEPYSRCMSASAASCLRAQ